MKGKKQIPLASRMQCEKVPVRLFNSIFFFISSPRRIVRDRGTFYYVIIYHQGHDPSTYWRFLWGTNGRIYPGYGRTTETARNPYNGLCTKIGQALMDTFMSATEAQAHGLVDLVAVG